jgi:LPS sulfotransferase NodH
MVTGMGSLAHEAKVLIRKQEARLQQMALDMGLKRGRQDYTKFILLSRSRTGSNLVRSLLNAHSAVVVFGEVFRNPDAVDFALPNYETDARTLALYQRDPLVFLNTRVFRRMPRQVQAVGFKLFYYHARTDPWATVWPYLRDLAGLRVIHIKRRNILRTHLSRARAERSDRWVNLSGEPEQAAPVELSYAACLQDFTQTRQWEREADDFFAAHPRLDLAYEDLEHDHQPAVAQLLGFLDLPPEPIAPETHKQSQQPLAAAIANYADLKRQFAGSEWEAFFEE